MKKVIRRGTFETNSSSTHSLTMCTKETYDKWKNGELLFHRWDEEFVEHPTYSEEELKKAFFEDNAKRISNGFLYDNTYYTDIDEMISKVEVPAKELKDIKERSMDDLQSYDSYWEYDSWSSLEGFEETYTTPSGETIIAFGKYGYDG